MSSSEDTALRTRRAYVEVDKLVGDCLPKSGDWDFIIASGNEHKLLYSLVLFAAGNAGDNVKKNKAGMDFAKKFLADSLKEGIPLKYEVRMGYGFSASKHVVDPEKQQDVVLDALEAFVKREAKDPNKNIDEARINKVFAAAREALEKERSRYVNI